MEFSIQPVQLAYILVIIAIYYYAYTQIKRKRYKKSAAVIAIFALISFFSPIRFKQSNMSAVENSGFNSVPSEIPEKVTVEVEGFKTRNQRQYNELKSKNEETQNEINK